MEFNLLEWFGYIASVVVLISLLRWINLVGSIPFSIYGALINTVTAGLFLASVRNESLLNIELDYAVSEYRDFKTGKFINNNHQEFFLSKGYENLFASANNESHENYLLKMGFAKSTSANEYILKLK